MRRSSTQRLELSRLRPGEAIPPRPPKRAEQFQPSLFQVLRLDSPPDRFQCPDQGRGWQLDVRSKVQGHFKMQAHGAGQRLRKLIYVHGYWRGSESAPARRPLEQVA